MNRSCLAMCFAPGRGIAKAARLEYRANARGQEPRAKTPETITKRPSFQWLGLIWRKAQADVAASCQSAVARLCDVDEAGPGVFARPALAMMAGNVTDGLAGEQADVIAAHGRERFAAG
ncbi:MAG: hypothetical protein ACO1NY_03555 [Pseudorhodoplanes sp.]